MSNQLSKTSTLKGILASEKMQEQFGNILPSHISEKRFARSLMTAVSRNPKLAECTHDSFFRCSLDCAAMGIEPDGRRAHLIPYGKECTLILDYKGIVELMRRSGDVVSIHADVVCDNDDFSHNLGVIEKHTFDLKGPRGEFIAAYAQITFKDGSKQSAIMSKDEIDAIKNRSKAGKSGPWVTDFNEMAKKTVVRRVSKMVTLSPEIMDAVERSDRHEFGEMRNVTRVQVREKAIDPFEKLEAPSQKEEEPEDLWEDEKEEGGSE